MRIYKDITVPLNFNKLLNLRYGFKNFFNFTDITYVNEIYNHDLFDDVCLMN